MSTLTLPRIAAAILGDRPWYAAHPISPGHPDENNIMWLREPVLNKGLRWATETDRHMSDYTILDKVAVAEILYCSQLSPADGPTDALLCDTVLKQLDACGCNLGRCVARLATEYGDHQELAQPRMALCLQWAARIVRTAVNA